MCAGPRPYRGRVRGWAPGSSWPGPTAPLRLSPWYAAAGFLVSGRRGGGGPWSWSTWRRLAGSPHRARVQLQDPGAGGDHVPIDGHEKSPGHPGSVRQGAGARSCVVLGGCRAEGSPIHHPHGLTWRPRSGHPLRCAPVRPGAQPAHMGRFAGRSPVGAWPGTGLVARARDAGCPGPRSAHGAVASVVRFARCRAPSLWCWDVHAAHR